MFLFIIFFLQHALPLAGFLLFYEDILSHFSIFNSSGKYVTLLMFLFFVSMGIFSVNNSRLQASARVYRNT